MTTGSPARHILGFAMPLMLGSLLQQLYNMVDSWVVGNYVSNAALAAVGLAYPIMYIYQCLFIGIGSGGTVTIAQWYGAGWMDRVRDAVDTLYTAFVVGILPLTVLALALVGPMMRLMQVDGGAWQETWTYLTIITAGLIGSVGYNITAGILAGVGNSAAPCCSCPLPRW